MEALLLLPYVLTLLLVPFSLYLISFLSKNGTKDSKNHPPGSMGWPLLGENIEFGLLGPDKFIKRRMAKYSDEVFKSSLFGQKVAIFCGAQANKFIFMNENKLVNFWFPLSMLNTLGFPEFMKIKSKEEVSQLTQKFAHDFVKLEALKRYIMVMDAVAGEHLDNYWSTPNKVVKVYDMSKKYTFAVACRLLLNVADPEQIQKLFDPFDLINEGMYSLPIDFPGTCYNRAIKGSKKVRQELMRIIQDRRKELTLMQHNSDQMNSSTDALSQKLLQGNQDYSDMEICYGIIGLVLATHESSSSTMTSVMHYLAQLPHIYEEVFKEQMEIAKSKGPDELLTWQDIEKMKYSWNVVRESLRLAPPTFGGFREATTEFTYAGFTIPKGWKAIWTAHSSQMDPKYYPKPEKFDPSRFEGSGPAPHTFIPFGGGPRMCPGNEYARLLILVFIHNVVTRFKLKKAIPNEKISKGAFLPRPVYGLPVHLYPHEK